MKAILEKAKELVKLLEAAAEPKEVALSDLHPGEVFKANIGEFIVLEQMEGQTKVITKGLYREEVQFGSSTDYKKSSLKELCDGEILPEFEKTFGQDNIVLHTADLTTMDGQTDFGTVDGKVRPLTFEEARKFNNLLADKNLPGWWWTCTPWSTPERGWERSVAVVTPSGIISNYVYGCRLGVRPFCILKSNIFVSKGE